MVYNLLASEVLSVVLGPMSMVYVFQFPKFCMVLSKTPNSVIMPVAW